MTQPDVRLRSNKELTRSKRVSDDVLSLDSWSEADGSTKPTSAGNSSSVLFENFPHATSLSRNASTESDSYDERTSPFLQSWSVYNLPPSPDLKVDENFQTSSSDKSVILSPQKLTRVSLTCGSSQEETSCSTSASVKSQNRTYGAKQNEKQTDHLFNCYESSHFPATAHSRNFMYLPKSENHKSGGISSSAKSHQHDSHLQPKNTQPRDSVPRYFKLKKQSHKNKTSLLHQRHSSTNSPHSSNLPPTHTSNSDQDSFTEQSEKVKTKLLSVWNNVKYGWTIKTKTSFRYDSPIFLLGKCYHSKSSDEDDHEHRVYSIEEFKKDFTSKMWFTYRREFPQISGTKFTTDCGWGCMLRSGQMMISQALVNHFIGRDWRLYSEQSRESVVFHQQILKWFGDLPSDNCPFSVHKLIEYGKPYGKEPGDWYGPASVAHILRDALHKSWNSQPLLADICIYVAQDCTIYLEDVSDLCTMRPHSSSKLSSSTDSETEQFQKYMQENPNGEWKRAVIILIPVRLGGDELNDIYIPCVRSILAQDHCIGLIGGKPKHSLYFVGWQDSKLINLDPHYCQEFVDVTKRDFPIHSFHCMSPRKTPFSKMDPSCTVGFFCKNKQEFDRFVQQTEEMVSPPKQKGLYPMFIFSEGRGADVNLDGLTFKEEGFLKVKHYEVDDGGNMASEPFETEEFVVL